MWWAKSCRSRAGSHFYGKNMRFGLILGQLAILDKKIGPIISNFRGGVFMFLGSKKILNIILKKNLNNFFPLKTWKNCHQKLLIIGQNFFFHYSQPAQNQPKSHIFSIKWLPARHEYECISHIVALSLLSKSYSKKTRSYQHNEY